MVSDVNSSEGYACVGGGDIWEISVTLNSVVNLKTTPPKSKIIKKKIFGYFHCTSKCQKTSYPVLSDYDYKYFYNCNYNNYNNFNDCNNL